MKITQEKIDKIVSESIEEMFNQYNNTSIENQEQEKRYVIECSMYVYAKSDEDAVKIGKFVADKMNDATKDDGRATLDKLYERPYGIEPSREIRF